MNEIVKLLSENAFLGVIALALFFMMNTQVIIYMNASIFEMRIWKKSKQVIAQMVRKVFFVIYLFISLIFISALDYTSLVRHIVSIVLMLAILLSFVIWLDKKIQIFKRLNLCLTQKIRLFVLASFAYSFILYSAILISRNYFHATEGMFPKGVMSTLGALILSILSVIVIFTVADLIGVSSRKIYIRIDNDLYSLSERLSDTLILLKHEDCEKYKIIKIEDLLNREVTLSD